MMKAKATLAVDVGNEGVPDDRSSPEQEDDDEDDEDAVAAPGLVVLRSFLLIL